MSIGEFIKDKILIISCNMLIFILLVIIILASNVDLIIILFIFCIWFFH